jgi:hypothetical protein
MRRGQSLRVHDESGNARSRCLGAVADVLRAVATRPPPSAAQLERQAAIARTPIEALGLRMDVNAPADDDAVSQAQRPGSAATADGIGPCREDQEDAKLLLPAATQDVKRQRSARHSCTVSGTRRDTWPLSATELVRGLDGSMRSGLDRMHSAELRAVISCAGMSYADVDKQNEKEWLSFPVIKILYSTFSVVCKTPWGEMTNSDYMDRYGVPRLRQRAREALAVMVSQPTASLLAHFEAVKFLHDEYVLRGVCVRDMQLPCTRNIAWGYTQCLAEARSLGNRQAEMVVLGSLGELYAAKSQECKGLAGQECDRFASSYEWYEDSSRALCCGLPDDWVVTECGHGRDLHRAIEYHTQALAISRELGDRKNEAAILGNLGKAYIFLSSRMLRPGHLRYAPARLRSPLLATDNSHPRSHDRAVAAAAAVLVGSRIDSIQCTTVMLLRQLQDRCSRGLIQARGTDTVRLTGDGRSLIAGHGRSRRSMRRATRRALLRAWYGVVRLLQQLRLQTPQ